MCVTTKIFLSGGVPNRPARPMDKAITATRLHAPKGLLDNNRRAKLRISFIPTNGFSFFSCFCGVDEEKEL
jgi:hypothetical protein